MNNALQKNKTLGNEKWKNFLAFLIIFSLFYAVGYILPVGFDWVHFFSQGRVSPIWTPWTVWIIKFLNFPLLVAITLTGLVLRTYKYSKSPIPVILAILSLPTLWVLHLGNLDGLVLVGILFLPFGIPLVLMKPQLAVFSVLAKKSSFIAAVAWGSISLLLWGLWPLELMAMNSPGWKEEWVQDITLFPFGFIIAIPLLWLSRGDEDLLMAAGSFATPHLFPYHFILLMPSLARMKWFWMLPAWLLSWSPLLANWFGPSAWHFGNVFAGVLWLGIYFSSKKRSTDHQQDRNNDKTRLQKMSSLRNPYGIKGEPDSSHSKVIEILSSFPEGIKVLDVGAASGILGKQVPKGKYRLFGIEPNPLWAQEAEHWYEKIFVGRLDQIDDDNVTGYDVIVCADILEHLPNPEEQLARLVDLQKPSSVFLISVPNIANIWVRMNLVLGRFEYSERGILDRTHLRFFTLKSFQALLESCGLSIKNTESTPIPLGLVNPFFVTTKLGKLIYMLLRILTRLHPTLFGYQFLSVAIKK